ncbi:uncharacterized protein N7446_009513 [Penicillium canescens]|uniref:Uncharacterized protein n=1 Tax=Penicillium canescens TaxID=5083 RepID=A0AAD6I7C4_PENCN|nr:uncharacterized protein N7446_009513 [Penicillium canescens]KAJ6034758.1 hypothetical protein N7460_008933 [Penicillium canescens]KAJ6046421.1 hypothetical protein N7444_007675 [Penicillium canescens]KAJ6053501.1 hypothetical protein N7446_009513 [Penicillium canescens]
METPDSAFAQDDKGLENEAMSLLLQLPGLKDSRGNSDQSKREEAFLTREVPRVKPILLK